MSKNLIIDWFSEKKLNNKFTIIIGIIVFIPICAILFLLFSSLNNDLNRHAINSIKFSMSQTYGNVQKTVTLCNPSTHVI